MKYRTGINMLPFVVAALLLLGGLGLDMIYDYSYVRVLQPYRLLSEAVSALGLGWTQALVIAVMFFYSRKKNIPCEPRLMLRGASMASAAAFVFGAISSQALKHLIGRARPYVGEPWRFEPLAFSNRLASLPSGHTTTSFALAFVLASFFPRWRWIFYGLALLVGISRITLGKHYPLDVASGACLGILSGWLAMKWYNKRRSSTAR